MLTTSQALSPKISMPYAPVAEWEQIPERWNGRWKAFLEQFDVQQSHIDVMFRCITEVTHLFLRYCHIFLEYR